MNNMLSGLAIALTLLMPVAIALQFSSPAAAQPQTEAEEFIPPDTGGPDQTDDAGTR